MLVSISCLYLYLVFSLCSFWPVLSQGRKQGVVLQPGSYGDTEAVATERHRMAVAHNDALSYQIIIDFHGIDHPHQKKVGMRRIQPDRERQLPEWFFEITLFFL